MYGVTLITEALLQNCSKCKHSLWDIKKSISASQKQQHHAACFLDEEQHVALYMPFSNLHFKSLDSLLQFCLSCPHDFDIFQQTLSLSIYFLCFYLNHKISSLVLLHTVYGIYHWSHSNFQGPSWDPWGIPKVISCL